MKLQIGLLRPGCSHHTKAIAPLSKGTKHIIAHRQRASIYSDQGISSAAILFTCGKPVYPVLLVYILGKNTWAELLDGCKSFFSLKKSQLLPWWHSG